MRILAAIGAVLLFGAVTFVIGHKLGLDFAVQECRLAMDTIAEDCRGHMKDLTKACLEKP